MLTDGATDGILPLVTHWHSLDPEIRQSTHIARVLRRSPMFLKGHGKPGRRRRRVGEHDAVRDLNEKLAERKGRTHHRRIDGDWSCLSPRAGRRGCTTLHHWTTRARDRGRRTCD